MELLTLSSVRTHNFNDLKILEKIIGLWRNGGKMLETLNYHGDRYALYHEYESDYDGEYTLTLAIPTEGLSETLLEDREAIVSLDSEVSYQAFEVDTFDPNGVIAVWQEIWTLEEEGKLQRAYGIDYEKYSVDGSVTIYIGLAK